MYVCVCLGVCLCAKYIQCWVQTAMKNRITLCMWKYGWIYMNIYADGHDRCLLSFFALFWVPIIAKELLGMTEHTAQKWDYVMEVSLFVSSGCGRKIAWNCQFVLRIFKAICEMYGEWFGIQALYVFHFYVWLQVWKKNIWDVFDFDILKTSA